MKMISGSRLWVPDRDTHFCGMGPKADHYQWDRIEAALKYTRDRELAVDAGAHVGLVTRCLAAHFKHVIAVEPDPDNFACLERNLKRYDNVTLRRAAFGQNPGKCAIRQVSPDNTGNTQVIAGEGDVELITLDSLNLKHLDLLKMDLQGSEYLLVNGGRRTLHRYRPVCIVEVEPPGKLPEIPGVPPGGAHRILRRLGGEVVENVGDDHIYTLPLPKAVPFDKYISHGAYHWRKYEENGPYKVIVDRIVELIKAHGHTRILDAGCGDGVFTVKLGAFGIDNDPVAIKLAQDCGAQCEVREITNLEELGRFDAVCLFDVFEHLEDQVGVLRRLGEVTDCLYFLNPEPCGSRYHTREYTLQELKEFLVNHGWQVLYAEMFIKSAKDSRSFVHAVKRSGPVVTVEQVNCLHDPD